jgi:aminodeoxyfutalosine synthase
MPADPLLETIAEKVAAGERVTSQEAIALFQVKDLPRLGQLADSVCTQKNGAHAYYNINHHIDYSNICVLTDKCKFCAFAKHEGDPEGFFHSLEYYESRLNEALKEGITEVHIVGGLHPKLPFDYYLKMLRSIKGLAPDLHVKAFTAVEIDFFARLARLSIEETLQALMAAGLDSMPGGGAEILARHVRDEICKEKIDGKSWLEIHRIAHGMNLRSNATMLYGHVENIEDRVDHMEQLRQLQDETGGFMSFIPLAFNPENNLMSDLGWTNGSDDLRTLAISRIYLDNFDHIKTYWITSGVGIAQLGLRFGADDIHGTVREENITHMAGSDTPQVLTVPDLRRLIIEMDREPHERDSLYNILN